MDIPLKAREIVRQVVQDNFDPTDHEEIDLEDVYIVWFSYTLGNWKALVSTTIPDLRYYEVTHKRENDGADGPAVTYVDIYTKIQNIAITNGETE